MKAAPTIAFVIAALSLKEVECNSAGAPSAACDSLMPNPAVGAHGADPRDTAVPYAIDYAAFDRTPNDNMLAYYPGRTYTVTLTGNSTGSEAMFRGFLVQTRTYADDSRVGTFVVTDSTNSQLSACTPNTDGVTHTDGSVVKSYVSFDWTAPAAGTGPLRFRFAAVEMRMIYWANESSAILQELATDMTATATDMTPTTAGAVTTSSVGFWSVLVVAMAVAIKATF